MRSSGHTLVEALVVLAIIGVLLILVIAAFDARRLEGAISGKRTEPPPGGLFAWHLTTVQYEGHWIIASEGALLHHPDCPCFGRSPEKEVE